MPISPITCTSAWSRMKAGDPPSWRRSATAPLTMVAEVMQNAHWKNQLRLPSPAVITSSSPKVRKVEPAEANSEVPMKPPSGTSPYLCDHLYSKR